MWAYRTCIVVLLAAIVAFGLAPPSRAQQPVDLELVLAVDVSWSMDLDEQQLQREGYVSALRDPEVWKAISSGGEGRIALMYIEWAGQLVQQIVMPWTLIDSPEALETFASKLEKMPISRERMTSLSGAIDFSARQFRTGFVGKRRVIDVSGDGPNNSGGPVEHARDRAVKEGIVINGLPIILKPNQRSGFFDINTLDKYYTDCVIGGFGSFVIPVRARSEFAPAIRRKLILEIAELLPEQDGMPRFIRTQMSVPEAERSDCLVGEKLWRLYIDGRFRE